MKGTLTHMSKTTSSSLPESWDLETDVVVVGSGFAAFVETGYDNVHEWPSYSFLPEEFVAFVEGCGLQIERLYGAQGIAAHLPPDNLEALMADPGRWAIWRSHRVAGMPSSGTRGRVSFRSRTRPRRLIFSSSIPFSPLLRARSRRWRAASTRMPRMPGRASVCRRPCC